MVAPTNKATKGADEETAFGIYAHGARCFFTKGE